MADTLNPAAVDSKLDLVLSRVVDVPVSLVWEAWSKPEHIRNWWAPRPWMTPVCEIDLRSGGIFRTVMRGPEGQEFDNTGCLLEVIPRQKIVFTDAVGIGYRPAKKPFMTAIVTMEDLGAQTRYTATVLHHSEEDRVRHEQMGFFEGWGTVLTQLADYARELGAQVQ
jgi:uncharacterized protein YndB with AHSA1/START domain